MLTVDVISHFGTPAAVARALKISRAAVSKWQKQGIVPEGSAYKLQFMTGGALQVDPTLYGDDAIADAIVSEIA